MLYLEIKRLLIADIQSGASAPGAALPNETELARRFNVSVGTLRRAVDELVAEHILVRQQGRGTFVKKLDRDCFMFRFFKIDARSASREFPEVCMHTFAKSRASIEEAQVLGLQTGNDVFRIHTLLWLKSRPVMHDHIVISAAMFSGLSVDLFTQRSATIYGLYQTEFGITIVETDERLRAELVATKTAKLLGLSAGMPVLRIVRVAYTFERQPVELRTSFVDTRHVDYVSHMRDAA